MPKKIYYLTQDEKNVILITWGMAWKNVQIYFNDTEVGRLENRKELKEGREFDLGENKKLSIRLIGKFLPELELLINGEVVPGSATDPNIRLKHVVNMGLTLGGFAMVGGVAAEVFEVPFLMKMGLGWEHVISGALFFLLAIGAFNKMGWAVWAMVLILAIDILAILIQSMETGSSPINGLFFKAIIMFYLFRGIGAIKDLKRKEIIPLFELDE